MGQSVPHNITFYDQRDHLFNELHTRPFPVISSPARVSQLSVLHQVEQTGVDFRLGEYQHICNLCARYSVNPPTEEASCYYQDFGGFEFRWERHTEFSTYTFIHQLESQPFEKTGLSLLPSEWLEAIPGKVISGLHVEVEEEQSHNYESSQSAVDAMRNNFEGHRLLSCFVRDKQAQVWTAYRIHSDSMGRFLIVNKGLNPCQTGRLVRRILELETYRMMALLSFPIAKQTGPNIHLMNLNLAEIIQNITEIKNLDDERRLMGALTHLSAQIEQTISETNYRFSATEAYYHLAMSRLEELKESEVCGLQTLSEFLSRRLTPAYLTCETIEKDLDDLSRRIDRASELLRTRMNLTIESQNQNLLQSMNRRGKLQLRMQQAVEGLSVAAISYYLVGLVKYVAESAKSGGLIESSTLVTGISVPFAIGFVMFGLGRMKRKLHKENEKLKGNN
ncbi:MULTISPECIES: DUF3422 family protein [unclassified Oleiphilus]|jgi:uncharacterized membrane-anchored protein|nr:MULTISPECIES: DUF3422 domain-containing protein [unclassified Oleiphilus]KZY45372.1 hypothetical protein A3732_10505 [Oleiphilus sp. HI0050]KZY76465.1 hypothetical protein A3740_01900 [Oleiphilus sp. HI0068]KZY77101.1 hypothetical protein A3741_22700 [Oleiphilus sp. HI0069]KZZ10134.1 hypothetical protein A3749_11910 [Oleiphilus sp. HI0078]KZY38756.1 hypothetical protein A3729_15785 [Oleiphilus sp. HI0043]